MIDFAAAPIEAFLGFGTGCSLTWAFATRTTVKAARDQLAREREMFEVRLTKQEQRFIEQIAQAKSHLEDYKEQLRICQKGNG
ncbi:MAG: hypothetical protein VW258_11480 [Thalassolituus sp.]